MHFDLRIFSIKKPKCPNISGEGCLREMSKGRKFILLGLGFIFVTILVLKYESEYPSSSQFKGNYTELKETDPEIRNILQSTPNLWRQFTFTKNETVSTRIESQRLWIQRISDTDYIQSAKVKKILIQPMSYYFTGNRLKCPYAPTFKNKCQLVKEKAKDNREDVISKYVGISGYVGVRNKLSKFLHIDPIVPNRVQQVMYILEPPMHAKYQIGRHNAILASYWRGSDIPIPYRRWIPREEKTDRHWRNVNFSKKTRQVAALISNCESMTKQRLKYIKKLKEYIDVDFYGRCGDLKCPRDCLDMLGKNYKFYLAFENSKCVDYITEKFFINALSHDMLPIVMGAHPENYKSAAPPNSFIHVDDFESPKALAEYLQILDRNESLYQKYFEWRGTGEITHDGLDDFFCRVCGMLFYADFIPIPKWDSKLTTFSDVNYCLPSNQEHWDD